MKQYNFYHKDTGLVHGLSIVINSPDHDATLKRNCPEDHVPIEGQNLHPTKHRVDIGTGEVLDHKPELTQEQRRQRIVAEIDQLASGTMHLMREAIIGNIEALHKLTDINNQISELRKQL